MQTSYSNIPLRSGPGVLMDGGPHKNMVSKVAEESIPFGRAVVYGKNENFVRLPRANAAYLSFDALMEVGNVIDGKVNGTPIATVFFNTDNDQTLTDLALSIEGHVDVESAQVVPEGIAGSQHILVIANEKSQNLILSDFFVVGGVNQPSAVIDEKTSDKFFGVSVHDQSVTSGPSDSEPVYTQGQALPVLRSGRINVDTLPLAAIYASTDIKAGDPVYFEFRRDSASVNRLGKFDNGSFTLGQLPDYANGFVGFGAEYVMSVEKGDLSAIEINLPIEPMNSKVTL